MALNSPYRVSGASPRPRLRRRGFLGGGTAGNEQLTAVTGVILLVMLAVLGITILRIGQMLWLHLFLGVLLVGPLALKMASTGYRFTRYYTGDRAYRRKGPPDPLMRALAPLLVLSTIAVFLTGGLLLFIGPYSSNLLREAHKLTFFAWLATFGLHVLGHLAELPDAMRAVAREERRNRALPGSRGRGIAMAVSIAAGLILAFLFLPDVDAWTRVGLYRGTIHFGG